MNQKLLRIALAILPFAVSFVWTSDASAQLFWRRARCCCPTYQRVDYNYDACCGVGYRGGTYGTVYSAPAMSSQMYTTHYAAPRTICCGTMMNQGTYRVHTSPDQNYQYQERQDTINNQTDPARQTDENRNDYDRSRDIQSDQFMPPADKSDQPPQPDQPPEPDQPRDYDKQ